MAGTTTENHAERLHASRDAAAVRRVTLCNETRGTVVGDAIAVADTGELRRKGLLGRAGLEPGEGLWIVPCESVHTWFMKFALDLVYLDRDGVVVKVVEDVPPWRVSACLRARSIVELPAGAVRRSRIQRGDVLRCQTDL